MAFPTLDTPRLTLRAFIPGDLGAVQSWAGREDNTLFMQWGPNTLADTKAFLDLAIAEAAKPDVLDHQFAAVLKTTGKPIGAGNLHLYNKQEGELGWIVHHDHWGKGYATEMARSLMAYAFDTLGLHRLIAHCDACNMASYTVMEKLGMRREGCFLEARPPAKNSGKPYGDELSYAILRREYEAQK